MDNRSTVQTFWRAARGGLARLSRLISEGDPADQAIFFAPPRPPERRERDDAERRIAEARKARLRN